MECVRAEGEGGHRGSGLGETNCFCTESLQVRRNTCVTASEHISCSKGLHRHSLVSDARDTHVRGGTTMVPGEGSVKNHFISRGKERSSPVSVFSFVRLWVQDRGRVLL